MIFSINGKEFLATIKVAKAFSSTEETSFYLCGLYLCSDKPDMLSVVATDGNKLFSRRMPLSNPVDGGEKLGFIIPNDSVGVISALITKSLKSQRDANVEIFWDGTNRITIGCLDSELSITGVEGTFPDYKRVFPDGDEPKYNIGLAGKNVSAITGALKNFGASGFDWRFWGESHPVWISQESEGNECDILLMPIRL